MLIHTTNESFEKDVLKNEKTVLADFFATWCGPCKMLSPVIEKIAAEHDEIDVVKIDVDEAGLPAVEYKVSSVPTLMVFKGGEIVKKAIGFAPEDEILEMIK